MTGGRISRFLFVHTRIHAPAVATNRSKLASTPLASSTCTEWCDPSDRGPHPARGGFDRPRNGARCFAYRFSLAEVVQPSVLPFLDLKPRRSPRPRMPQRRASRSTKRSSRPCALPVEDANAHARSVRSGSPGLAEPAGRRPRFRNAIPERDRGRRSPGKPDYHARRTRAQRTPHRVREGGTERPPFAMQSISRSDRAPPRQSAGQLAEDKRGLKERKTACVAPKKAA